MVTNLADVYDLLTQVVAIERSAETSTITPECQSYVDVLKRCRQAMGWLTQELGESHRQVHAWERAGVAGAVSPPEVMEVDRCS